MKLQPDTSLFFWGFGIGLSIAVLGGLVDYLLSKRKNKTHQTNHLPGCMLYVAGILGLIGVMAIIISIILIGSIVPALVLGAGVLGGFYTGFALLMLLYLVARQVWSKIGR